MFTLEVLKAKHGDCLFLHHGDDAAPRHILIDGGPRGAFRQFLKPHLRHLQEEDDPARPVKLDLVMVSHIDQDHIRGVLDLAKDMAEALDDRQQPLANIGTLWHNAFADFVPNGAGTAEAAESGALKVADIADPDVDLVLQPHTKLVLSSVNEGRQLRDLARRLNIDVNPDSENGLVLGGHELTDGDLTLKVLGPTRADADDLKVKWDKEVKKLLEKEEAARMDAAAYLDRSVFNLSSIVVLAEQGGHRMLLTGDARGDKILENLEQQALLDDDGKIHVDVLKLPHHGSDRNVEDDFFERVTADHYVISCDGRHHNPELETYRMLFRARQDDRPYTIHVTYPPEELKSDYPADELEDLLDEAEAAGANFRMRYPEDGQSSMTIALG
ncbi:MAG: ComEC/Rec2 family competence protein [Geminicoccaceae bacterium]